MRRLKLALGVLLLCMAMGELAAGFLALPAAMEWCLERTEWWATYFPVVMLINSLVASVMLMYFGIKVLKEGSFLTEKQALWFEGRINRWIEKRKYGYCKSDYVIKEGGQE